MHEHGNPAYKTFLTVWVKQILLKNCSSKGQICKVFCKLWVLWTVLFIKHRIDGCIEYRRKYLLKVTTPNYKVEYNLNITFFNYNLNWSSLELH